MSQPSREMLAATLGRTLEEAAFLFVEAEEHPPPFQGAVLEARLRYAGDHAGELILAMEPALAAFLAANLLGEDEAEAARSADAVGELLNMAAGMLAVELFGPDQSCRLGVPEVREVSAEDHLRAFDEATCAVSLVEEAGRRIDVAARVSLEPERPR